MEILKSFLKELENETITTRKMLSIIPDDRYDWQPHPKSMTIRRLATHIADIGTWFELVLEHDELDLASGSHQEPEINNTAQLLEYFEQSFAKGKASLENARLEQLDEFWTMRNGEQVCLTDFKGDVIRASFCQITHHRAQLGVYLRLLDIAIPGSYGPSADEMEMQAQVAEA